MKNVAHIINFFIVAVLLLLAGSSCKDKNKKTYCQENPSQCQTISEAKDFFYFKMGSFWVYEEETTHERDSMYVTESYNDPGSFGFEMRIKSSLTDYEYHYWPVYYQNIKGCSLNSPVNRKCVYIKRSKYKFQDVLGDANAFFVNYKVGDYTYSGNALACPNNKLIISAILDSLVLPNFTFQKTVKIDELCSSQEGNQPVRLFYTQGVGIVRKEFLDSNQVWNLVNYNIIP